MDGFVLKQMQEVALEQYLKDELTMLRVEEINENFRMPLHPECALKPCLVVLWGRQTP